MNPDRSQQQSPPLPDTRQDLPSWVRETIPLPDHLHDLLLAAVERIFDRHEQLWQASKQDAMRAMSQGFADQLARLKHQLAAKDATVSNISEYFENLVSSLSEKAGRDAKTNLLNFPRFEEALTILLATERRINRCAVGLIDIAHFKWYNDTCGHLVGDQIIEKVSMLLRQHMRDRDLVAKDPDAASHTVHARFGGDEFCFLIADLAGVQQIDTICRRFSDAVGGYDWVALDPRLGARPVRVDIGVACLDLGPLADRRLLASRFAKQLIEWGDTAMYRAKADRDGRTQVVLLQVEGGELVTKDATIADSAPHS
ncbi:MAG: GGDEF domain-containing protein [Vicinamibacterales bacterium]